MLFGLNGTVVTFRIVRDVLKSFLIKAMSSRFWESGGLVLSRMVL